MLHDISLAFGRLNVQSLRLIQLENVAENGCCKENKEVTDCAFSFKMSSLFGIGPKLSGIGKEQELLDASRTGNLDVVRKLLTKQEKGKKSTVGKLTR